MVTVGRGIAEIVTACDALPPAPVQVRVYVPVAFTTTVAEPAVVFVPVHAPEAVHEVVFIDDHVSVVDWPAGTEESAALKVTMGFGNTVTVTDLVALPPRPEQVRV